MNRGLLKVLLQRERLLARIEQQRADAEACLGGLARPARVVDAMMAGTRFLRAHPAAVAGIVAAAFVVRGRTLVGMITRGVALWRLARRAQALAHHFG